MDVVGQCTKGNKLEIVAQAVSYDLIARKLSLRLASRLWSRTVTQTDKRLENSNDICRTILLPEENNGNMTSKIAQKMCLIGVRDQAMLKL